MNRCSLLFVVSPSDTQSHFLSNIRCVPGYVCFRNDTFVTPSHLSAQNNMEDWYTYIEYNQGYWLRLPMCFRIYICSLHYTTKMSWREQKKITSCDVSVIRGYCLLFPPIFGSFCRHDTHKCLDLWFYNVILLFD